jgi:hypothetical protein
LVFQACIDECTVQEAKFPLKYLVRQRCAEGFNSGVKGLTIEVSLPLSLAQNWSEACTVQRTTRQTKAYHTSLSVPVEPDVMSVRQVCNRSAMDPVLLQTSVGHVLSSGPLPGFIVGTHQSEIRDILISVFTDVSKSVICDSLTLLS